MSLTGLSAEIDAVEAADLSDDPTVLGAEILDLDRAVQRLLAQKSRRLGAFDRAEGYVDDQQTSTRSWLRTQTFASPGQAAAEEGVSRVRGRLPRLFATWDLGETTFEHVRAVEVALRQLPEELWPEVDGPIAEKARVLSAKDLGAWLRELADALRPDPKPRDESQHEARRLSISPGFDGMTNVVGRLAPEVAEKLHAALSAASRPDATDEIRLPNQRQADALEAVLDVVLDSGQLPAEGGQRPHLTLIANLDQVSEGAQRDEEDRRRTGDLWARSAQERSRQVQAAVAAADAASDARSGRPRYYWTGTASVMAARRLGCDGHLLPIFTRGGQAIDVGRHTRKISDAMRALIVARDQHCRWPGCTMPARWSQIHHLVHWRDGGPTDRWNLILICEHHHRAAHDGRWTVIVEGPGQISVCHRRRPDDPYYELRHPAPPPPGTIDLNTKLRAAAERARASVSADVLGDQSLNSSQ